MLYFEGVKGIIVIKGSIVIFEGGKVARHGQLEFDGGDVEFQFEGGVVLFFIKERIDIFRVAWGIVLTLVKDDSSNRGGLS